jgi:hypothetical protein
MLPPAYTLGHDCPAERLACLFAVCSGSRSVVMTILGRAMVKDTEEGRERTINLQDKGAVSRVTCGDIIRWPWLENTPAPFNHICVLCDEGDFYE